MDFIDRIEEMQRLDRLMASREGGLAVVYGRRRIGKTRLLLEWSARHGGLYTVADQSAARIQRRYFAEAVGARLPGFADVDYRDWRGLLERLANHGAALKPRRYLREPPAGPGPLGHRTAARATRRGPPAPFRVLDGPRDLERRSLSHCRTRLPVSVSSLPEGGRPVTQKVSRPIIDGAVALTPVSKRS